MKNLFFLSALMSMTASLNAQTADLNEGHAMMKRNADRLRIELKHESDQRMSPKPAVNKQKHSEQQMGEYASAPQHTVRQHALMNDEPVYKERLDSIVSVNDNKLAFTYDDRGNMLTQEFFTWDMDAWQRKSLQESSYDESNYRTLVKYNIFNGTEYVPSEISYDHYFDEENHRVISGYAIWNEEHQDWAFSWISVSDLDEQGREIAYTYYLDWDYKNWQPTKAYEHYEVAYLDEDVVETTFFRNNGYDLVPNEKRRVKNDQEHHYTLMRENLIYSNGSWYALEHEEELREYYGQKEWEYHQTYHEFLQAYGMNGKWDYGFKNTNRYDDHNNRIYYDEYAWDSSRERWKGRSLNESAYKYYSEEWGEIQVTTRNLTLNEWNDTYDTWAWGYLAENDYDDYRKWTYNAQASWSVEKNDWIYSFKEKLDREYDEQGRSTLLEQVSWNTETEEWEHPFLSCSYEYADDGLVTQTQYEMWDSSLEQWQEGWKTLTRKDDHDMVTYEFSNRWDASLQKFVPIFLYEYHYIYDEECKEGYMSNGYAENYKLNYDNWSEEMGTWTYGKKEEMTFDEKYRLAGRTTYYWIPSSQEFYKDEVLQQEFNAEGEMIEYQLDRYSEDGNPDFEYHDKWSRRFDANYNMIESCSYYYNLSTAEYWMATRKQYEYDITTPVQEVMGLVALYYRKDKPISYKYQEFSQTGEVINQEERYFYYTNLNAGGEGLGQTLAPVIVDIVDGRLTFSSESPADLSISNLDGKLMATAQQVRTYSLQLPAGVYVVTVNGESRKFRI